MVIACCSLHNCGTVVCFHFDVSVPRYVSYRIVSDRIFTERFLVIHGPIYSSAIVCSISK